MGLKIHDEYWILPDGELLYASDDSDYNHEGHVVERIISIIADFLGIEWDLGPDVIAFRCTLNDSIYPERYPEADAAGDDMGEILCNELVQAGCFTTKEMDAAWRALQSDADARAFAVDFWKWIRLAGNNAELPDLTPKTLKRLASSLIDILYEQEDGEGDDSIAGDLTMNISTYSGRGGRHTVSLNDLTDGRLGDNNHSEFDDQNRAAKAAVAKMDQEQMHPHYKGQLGDSTSILVHNLLEGYNDSDILAHELIEGRFSNWTIGAIGAATMVTSALSPAPRETGPTGATGAAAAAMLSDVKGFEPRPGDINPRPYGGVPQEVPKHKEEEFNWAAWNQDHEEYLDWAGNKRWKQRTPPPVLAGAPGT